MFDSECKNCNRKYIYDRSKGHRKFICNSCHAANRRKKREERIYQYKGESCIVCGYNKTRRALQLHHSDPAKKDFKISGNWGLSWEKIKKELDKCFMVCANCHAELHDGLRNI